MVAEKIVIVMITLNKKKPYKIRVYVNSNMIKVEEDGIMFNRNSISRPDEMLWEVAFISPLFLDAVWEEESAKTSEKIGTKIWKLGFKKASKVELE